MKRNLLSCETARTAEPNPEACPGASGFAKLALQIIGLGVAGFAACAALQGLSAFARWLSL